MKRKEMEFIWKHEALKKSHIYTQQRSVSKPKVFSSGKITKTSGKIVTDKGRYSSKQKLLYFVIV